MIAFHPLAEIIVIPVKKTVPRVNLYPLIFTYAAREPVSLLAEFVYYFSFIIYFFKQIRQIKKITCVRGCESYALSVFLAISRPSFPSAPSRRKFLCFRIFVNGLLCCSSICSNTVSDLSLSKNPAFSNNISLSPD